MKFACESAGFMPRSANHFIEKSRTAALRARSLVMNSSPCSWAAIAACIASTFIELVPVPASQAASFLMLSGWPTA